MLTQSIASHLRPDRARHREVQAVLRDEAGARGGERGAVRALRLQGHRLPQAARDVAPQRTHRHQRESKMMLLKISLQGRPQLSFPINFGKT